MTLAMALLDLIQLAEREADDAERAVARRALMMVQSDVVARLALEPILMRDIPA